MIESRLLSQGPWTPRRKHATIIWNQNIYILGGFDGGKRREKQLISKTCSSACSLSLFLSLFLIEDAGNLHDIWRLENDTWVLVCEHAGWVFQDNAF